MKVLICDTGPLVAALNDCDKHHTASVALFDGFVGALVVPSLIVTEVCYLAQNHVGPQAEARFLDSIVARELTVEHPTEQDWSRIAQLVRQYAGFPLGVADASVIAIADRRTARRHAACFDRPPSYASRQTCALRRFRALARLIGPRACLRSGVV